MPKLGIDLKLCNRAALGPSNPLLDGLLHWYKMDETSGVRVDATGSGEDLVDINTVTSAAGVILNASSYDAANSEQLRCPTYKPSGAGFALTCWAWPELNTNRTIFSSLFGNFGVQGYVNSITQLISLAGDGSSLANSSTAAFAITLNAWNFIAVWRDDDLNTWNTQINNGAITSAAMANPIAASAGDHRLTFFANTATGTTPGANPQTGELDLVGIWTRYLTADERTELYNSGSGIDYPFT